MKLKDTLKGLICEIAALDNIVDAIKNRQVVVIYYDGDEPGGRGIRQIEPVCLGVSKAGNKVLRAWDSEGSICLIVALGSSTEKMALRA